MPEERPIVEEVLDYALYAPVGLLLSVTEDLPDLVRKGRNRIEGPVRMARFVGNVALRNARRRLERFLETPERPPAEVIVDVLSRPTIDSEADAADAERAIHGYRTLAASQVVARLAGLSAEELAAVRAYEEATRLRRTILNRIAQLEQSGRDES